MNINFHVLWLATQARNILWYPLVGKTRWTCDARTPFQPSSDPDKIHVFVTGYSLIWFGILVLFHTNFSWVIIYCGGVGRGKGAPSGACMIVYCECCFVATVTITRRQPRKLLLLETLSSPLRIFGSTSYHPELSCVRPARDTPHQGFPKLCISKHCVFMRTFIGQYQNTCKCPHRNNAIGIVYATQTFILTFCWKQIQFSLGIIEVRYLEWIPSGEKGKENWMHDRYFHLYSYSENIGTAPMCALLLQTTPKWLDLLGLAYATA